MGACRRGGGVEAGAVRVRKLRSRGRRAYPTCGPGLNNRLMSRVSEMSITKSNVRNVHYFLNVRNVRSYKCLSFKRLDARSANFETESAGFPDIADTEGIPDTRTFSFRRDQP